MDKPTGDDRQLLRHIADGDRQALTELYARYQRLLFNYLLQLTPDYGLAEELVLSTPTSIRIVGVGLHRRCTRTWRKLMGNLPDVAWAYAAAVIDHPDTLAVDRLVVCNHGRACTRSAARIAALH